MRFVAVGLLLGVVGGSGAIAFQDALDNRRADIEDHRDFVWRETARGAELSDCEVRPLIASITPRRMQAQASCSREAMDALWADEHRAVRASRWEALASLVGL